MLEFEKVRSSLGNEGLKTGMVRVVRYNPLWARKLREKAEGLRDSIRKVTLLAEGEPSSIAPALQVQQSGGR